ncbi:MAG: FtsX-like permease family protein, partial [Actinomycetota bacterium]
MTTTLVERPASGAKSNGGGPARRAIVRWAWRLVRRDWRQQLLILALLTFSVAAAVSGASAAYNITPLYDTNLGSATHAVVLQGAERANPQQLATNLAAVKEWFGSVEPITHRTVPIPGSTEQLEVRSQDPSGQFGASMIRLRSGRYPVAAGELAITKDVATTFGTNVGGSLAIAGGPFKVVGLVENPRDLGDSFALEAPGSGVHPESVTVLVGGSADHFSEFGRRDLPGTNFLRRSTRGRGDKAAAAAGVVAISTLVLLLVALVSAASFTVIARRRLRQLGMLAAIGATEKHLRLVMVATGFVIGVVSSLLGIGLGLVLWVVGASRLEPTAQHRIDVLNVPWWTIGVMTALALATATAAAWMPARAVARVPITAALSARPPRPRKTHR